MSESGYLHDDADTLPPLHVHVFADDEVEAVLQKFFPVQELHLVPLPTTIKGKL